MKITLPFIAIAILSTLSFAYCLNSCPSCGNLPVPYPLSTGPSCGDPDYRLYCDNKVLELKSAKGRYYKVISIDPPSYSLVISPPSISPGSCISSDLTDGGLQIDDMSPFNISNRNTVLLFNCSQSLLLSPFNCSSNSVCRNFERVDEGIKYRKTLCCSFLKDSPSVSVSQRIRIRVWSVHGIYKCGRNWWECRARIMEGWDWAAMAASTGLASIKLSYNKIACLVCYLGLDSLVYF